MAPSWQRANSNHAVQQMASLGEILPKCNLSKKLGEKAGQHTLHQPVRQGTERTNSGKPFSPYLLGEFRHSQINRKKINSGYHFRVKTDVDPHWVTLIKSRYMW